MTNLSESVTVEVVLRGGPRDLDGTTHRVTGCGEDTIKVPHLDGYEHFARVAGHEPDDASAPVYYQWIMRTCIAE